MTDNKGFTIIELLVSTLVFSVILLLVTLGLLQIARTYYKGITSTKTQQAARTIMDDISRTIQFGGDLPTVVAASGSGGIGRVCVGNTRYTYKLDRQLVDKTPNSDQAIHVLVKDNPSGCTGNRDLTAVVTGNDRELMEPNMRLNRLYVQCNSTSKLCQIAVTVISGERDLLQDTSSPADGIVDKCANFQAGTQFCAVSTLSTVVQERL